MSTEFERFAVSEHKLQCQLEDLWHVFPGNSLNGSMSFKKFISGNDFSWGRAQFCNNQLDNIIFVEPPILSDEGHVIEWYKIYNIPEVGMVAISILETIIGGEYARLESNEFRPCSELINNITNVITSVDELSETPVIIQEHTDDESYLVRYYKRLLHVGRAVIKAFESTLAERSLFPKR